MVILSIIKLSLCNMKILCSIIFFQSDPFEASPSQSFDHSIQIQSAVRISEVTLGDNDGCLRKAMCVLGAISSSQQNGALPKQSIANAAQNFLHIAHQMIAAASEIGLTMDELPNLRQVVAR